MNVCVAHFQMNLCVAKNFGAWTENVGALSQIWRISCLEVAHCSLCNLNFGAWSEQFGHPWSSTLIHNLIDKLPVANTTTDILRKKKTIHTLQSIWQRHNTKMHTSI